MNIKSLINCFLVAILTVALVSCEKPDNNGGAVEEGPSFGGGSAGSGSSQLGEKTLLSLLNEIISKQGANTPRQKVYVVAHRANSYAGIKEGCPDNSIPAIEKAIEVGADMVELDVRTTSDGKLILMHNETINATTNGTGSVANMTLAQIKSYTMDRGGSAYKDKNGNTVQVPTLEEAMLACKGKIYVNLDIKAVKSPLSLLYILNQTGTMGQVMIYGGGKEYAEIAQQRGWGDIAIHPFIGDVSGVDSWKSVPQAKLFQYDYNEWYNNGNMIAAGVRAKGGLTYSNILSYDSHIIKATPNYTYIDKFIASETDFIQTDYCDKVHDYLNKKGLR